MDIPDSTFVVQLVDIKGNIQNYIVYVSLKCEIKEFVYKPTEFYQEIRYEEQVFSKSPPVPYIHSIDTSGLLRIRFNATMQEAASLID